MPSSTECRCTIPGDQYGEFWHPETHKYQPASPQRNLRSKIALAALSLSLVFLGCEISVPKTKTVATPAKTAPIKFQSF